MTHGVLSGKEDSKSSHFNQYLFDTAVTAEHNQLCEMLGGGR